MLVFKLEDGEYAISRSMFSELLGIVRVEQVGSRKASNKYAIQGNAINNITILEPNQVISAEKAKIAAMETKTNNLEDTAQLRWKWYYEEKQRADALQDRINAYEELERVRKETDAIKGVGNE